MAAKMKSVKRVYISTPLKPTKFNLDKIQNSILGWHEKVFAFIPTTAEAKGDPKKAAEVNKLMIDGCDEMWVFGPIGRDCAWEVGYAAGLGIPVLFFVDETNEHMIPTDWMLFNTRTCRVVR